MNSIQLQYKVDTKRFYHHRLLFYLTDKMNFKKSDKYVALSNLTIYYTWKTINKFKISTPNKCLKDYQ